MSECLVFFDERNDADISDFIATCAIFLCGRVHIA